MLPFNDTETHFLVLARKIIKAVNMKMPLREKLQVFRHNSIGWYTEEIWTFFIIGAKSAMKLNIKKCKIMRFHRVRLPTGKLYQINNEEMVAVDKINDLNIIFDIILSFVDSVLDYCSTIWSSCYQFVLERSIESCINYYDSLHLNWICHVILNTLRA